MEARNKKNKNELYKDNISLEDFTQELLKRIFSYLDPIDLSRIARVSKAFNASINASEHKFWEQYSLNKGSENYDYEQLRWLQLRFLTARVNNETVNIHTILDRLYLLYSRNYLNYDFTYHPYLRFPINQLGLNRMYEIIKVDHLANAEEAERKYRYDNFLFVTVEYNQVEEFKNLIQVYRKLHKITVNQDWLDRMLRIAAGNGHLEIFNLLIENGADAHSNRIYAHYNMVYGVTPLYIATIYGHSDIIHALLKQGANVHAATDIFGSTYLHQAVKRRYLKIVRIFLEEGVDIIDATDDRGFTPIYLAACLGYCEIVEMLLLHGANKNIVVYINKSKLIDQARKYSPEIFARTLAHIENFMTDMISISPAQIATIMGYSEIAMLLTNMHEENGAEVNRGLYRK